MLKAKVIKAQKDFIALFELCMFRTVDLNKLTIAWSLPQAPWQLW